MSTETQASPVSAVNNELSADYRDLKHFFAHLQGLFSIRALLSADTVSIMPAAALPQRLNDIFGLTKRTYAETISPSVTNKLAKVEAAIKQDSKGFSQAELANIREMRRIHDHFASLPPELYIASIKIMNEGRRRQQSALKGDLNVQETQAYLSQVLEVYRKIADHKAKHFQTKTPYSALLFQHAQDLCQTEVDALLNRLEPQLTDLYGALKNKSDSAYVERTEPLWSLSKGDQIALSRDILDRLGFDHGRGVLLASQIAPMADGTRTDTRVLIRYNDDAAEALKLTLYMGAKAIYIQNLPEGWSSQPVGQDWRGLMASVNAILFRNFIGGSKAFLSAFCAEHGGQANADALYAARWTVRPHAPRNAADPLTKFFHDIMRYRIEKDLISGDLEIGDLGDRWVADSEKLLGQTPEESKDGYLHNPDWFTGRYGYIALDTLAYVAAAQLYRTMQNDIGAGFNDALGKADLSQATAWMAKNVYSQGRLNRPLEMLTKLTDNPFDEQALVTFFKERYKV